MATHSSLPPPAGVTDLSMLGYYLTPAEAAALLRTTRGAIYARAERGLLPGAVKDGRRLLIRRDDLLRSLIERRAPSPGKPRR
jgi:excisionase family DNA binding protein